jgi:IrrE N-terminal-like domain
LDRYIKDSSAALLAWVGQTEPPISVHRIAVDFNVAIERVELPDTLPGFVAQIRGRWFIFVNRYHGSRRRRFTIAHELGHIALDHHGVVFMFGEGQQQERAANRFAAEVLMPEKMIRRAHVRAFERSLDIGDLADIFLVSKRAMEIRLSELHLDL